jgi:hypothetical protein
MIFSYEHSTYVFILFAALEMVSKIENSLLLVYYWISFFKKKSRNGKDFTIL